MNGADRESERDGEVEINEKKVRVDGNQARLCHSRLMQTNPYR